MLKVYLLYNYNVYIIYYIFVNTFSIKQFYKFTIFSPLIIVYVKLLYFKIVMFCKMFLFGSWCWKDSMFEIMKSIVLVSLMLLVVAVTCRSLPRFIRGKNSCYI